MQIGDAGHATAGEPVGELQHVAVLHDRHEPRDPGCISVADDAVALDDVVALCEPAPGPSEAPLGRVMVGVEHTDELTAHVAQSCVDVLRLRGAGFDSK